MNERQKANRVLVPKQDEREETFDGVRAVIQVWERLTLAEAEARDAAARRDALQERYDEARASVGHLAEGIYRYEGRLYQVSLATGTGRVTVTEIVPREVRGEHPAPGADR